MSELRARLPEKTARNRLLGALAVDEQERLEPHLHAVEIEQRTTLFEPEQRIGSVYFPVSCVVSLVNDLGEGGTVEVGTVGCEGLAGLSVFLGDDDSSMRAIVQVPGSAMRMDAGTFARFAAEPGTFQRQLLRYTQAFLTQVAQTGACNAVHLIEQRCARWLLMTHDRVRGDDFPLTHEYLAFMLGVRRAGVTVAMRALQDAELIRYTRGRVTIVDRAGLESTSCECYEVVRAHFDRLQPSERQSRNGAER